MHDVLHFTINGQDSTKNLHVKNTHFSNPTAPENENEIDQQHQNMNINFIINQSNLMSLSNNFVCAIVFIIHQINAVVNIFKSKIKSP